MSIDVTNEISDVVKIGWQLRGDMGRASGSKNPWSSPPREGGGVQGGLRFCTDPLISGVYHVEYAIIYIANNHLLALLSANYVVYTEAPPPHTWFVVNSQEADHARHFQRTRGS